jgi:predicted TIM-barrel enzyme
MPRFLEQLKSMGIAGVQNFPTVGLIDGQFRANLEETGMSFKAEVELIRLASSMDMLTTPYAFNVDEARQMAEAGADIVVAHMGLTTSGTIGAKTGMTLEDSVKAVQEIRDAAANVREDILVLCHGGPIATPQNAEFVLRRTKGVHGFYGASSVERLPVEESISAVVKEFKGLTVG